MPPAKSVSRVDREPVGSQGQSGEELGLEWEFLVPRPVAGVSTTLSCFSVCLILFTLLSRGNHTACSAHPQHRDFKRQYIFFKMGACTADISMAVLSFLNDKEVNILLIPIWGPSPLGPESIINLRNIPLEWMDSCDVTV